MGRVVRVPTCSGGKPEPNQPKVGRQHKAVRQVEQKFTREVWPTFDDPPRALMRSQRGPLTSAPLTALPTSRVTRIEAQPFGLLLCRRLRFPLPFSLRSCRCGRQLDSFGHDCAACHVAGVWGRREGGGTPWNVLLLRFVAVRSLRGLGPLQRTRCSKTRSCGRRAHTLARGTVGH